VKTKRATILAVVMVVSMWMGWAPAMAQGEGTVAEITNPGLEGSGHALGDSGKVTGTMAEGWSDNSGWAEVGVDYALDPVNPHGGLQSLRLDIAKVQSGAIQFVQQVKLAKGREYTVSAWLRGTEGSTVTLMLRRTDGAYKEFASTTVTLTSGWTECRATGVVEEDAGALLMVRAVAPMTVWVDDVQLTYTIWNTAIVPLKNPSFEAPYAAIGAGSGPGQVSGETAMGWNDNSDWADVTVVYSAEAANAHSGKSAQRVVVSGVRSGAVQFKQNVMLKAGRTYAMSVWLRGNVGSMVTLALRQTGGASTQYAGTTAALGPEWKEFRAVGPCTEDTDALFMIRASGPVTYWVDDARLEDVTDGM